MPPSGSAGVHIRLQKQHVLELTKDCGTLIISLVDKVASVFVMRFHDLSNGSFDSP